MFSPCKIKALPFLALILCFAPSANAADVKQGASLYPVCSACHGPKGLGNRAMLGPKLAGQDADYLLAQLRLFQSGARGSAQGDAQGRQMAAMSKGPQLSSDQALEDLVAYIGTFPNQAVPTSVEGDKDRGKGLYQTCAACHGDRAQGLSQMAGPSLQGQHDWYLLSQLKKYRAGQRGYAADHHAGRQMRSMMGVLAKEADYIDVVAYINTLSQE